MTRAWICRHGKYSTEHWCDDHQDRFTTTENDARNYQNRHADPDDDTRPTLAECQADEAEMRNQR